ncbi:DUF397 domain-containing protein [Streptomyces xiamenensis]|uniref:DUF397 domain-containing protein n=1 Tax=Streptomyces xiamenensis TaxID=408015 RepID=UPI0036E847F0
MSSSGSHRSDAEWITSSYSQGNGGQCVEFSRAFLGSGAVPVRDSKSPARRLLFPADSWRSFVRTIKAEGLE